MNAHMSVPVAPPLDYVLAPDAFNLPPGVNFGGTSGIALNSKGHIFVLHRGPQPESLPSIKQKRDDPLFWQFQLWVDSQ